MDSARTTKENFPRKNHLKIGDYIIQYDNNVREFGIYKLDGELMFREKYLWDAIQQVIMWDD